MSDHSEKLDAVIAEYLQRVESGKTPDPAEFVERHPDLRQELRSFFADYGQMEQAVGKSPETSGIDAASTPAPQQQRRHLAAMDSDLPRDFGDYQLLEVIAQGGMGIVYRAWQHSLKRVVAVKMILAGQLAGQGDVQRFYREAQAAGGLDHPDIVPVYEVGTCEGQHFFSMGYVDGCSLAHEVLDGPCIPQRAAEYTKQIAEAVHYAHTHGVVHRDIKPGNILLDRAGNLRITDFGLATRHDETSGMTVTGEILGTPAYMPPEQASGVADNIGPAADIYAIGAVLYCLLTFRPPFQSAHPVETLRQVLEDEPIAPRQLNPSITVDLETICLKCLEKDASRRYRSSQDLSKDLGRFLAGEPIAARPTSRLEKTRKWIGRHRVVSALLATVALSLVLGTAVSTWFAIEATNLATAEKQARENFQAKENEASLLANEKSALADAQIRTIGRLEDHLYAARMREAQIAFDAGDYDTTRRLMALYDVADGEKDHRCFAWHHLNYRSSRANPVVQALRDSGYSQESGRLVMSPDGNRFAFTAGTHVSVGKCENGQTEWSVSGERITDLCFTNDNRYLVVASGRAWDDDDWNRKGQLEHHRVVIYDLKQSGTDPTPIPESPLQLNLQGAESVGICVAASPTEPIIACGLSGGRIAIWNYATGKRVAELAFPPTEASGEVVDFVKLAFTPDGRKLVSARFAQSIDLWNLQTHRHEVELFRFPARVQYRQQYFKEAFWLMDAAALAISDDGATLAAAANGQDFVLINLQTHEVKEVQAHHDAITGLAFLSGRQNLVSASLDHEILMWNAQDATPLGQVGSHRSPVHGVIVPPSGNEVLSVGTDNAMRRWSISEPGSAPEILNTRNHVYALKFHPQSEQLFVGGWPTEGGAALWDTENGTRQSMLDWDRGRVKGVDVSRDGQIAVSANLEGNCIDVWNPARKRIRKILTSFDSEQISIHPDGSRVAASPFFESATSAVYDVRSGDLLQVIPGVSKFSPNGLWLATTYEGKLQLRDAVSLQPVETSSPDNVSQPRFSPDSRLLALKDSGTSFLVWDVEQQRVLFRADGHFGELSDYAFAPDGKTIASVGKDLRVLLWDLRTGQLKAELNGHSGPLRAVAFSTDGSLLATGGVDHTVRLWRAPDAANRFQPLSYQPVAVANVIQGAAPPSPNQVALATREKMLTSKIDNNRNNSAAWKNRAEFYRTHRRWLEASSDFARAIELSAPADSETLIRAAIVALRAGMATQYQECCRRLLDGDKNSAINEDAVRTVCLSFDSGVNFGALLSDLEQQSHSSTTVENPETLSLLNLRAGRTRDALRLLNEQQGDGETPQSPVRYLLTALCYEQLDATDKATAAERQANSAYLRLRGNTIEADDDLIAFEILAKEVSLRKTMVLTESLAETQVMRIHREADRLVGSERFDFLKTWVLPINEVTRERKTLRCYAMATNGSPSQREVDLLPVDREQLAAVRSAGQHSRIYVGGNLVCPAIELIKVAKQFNRLNELQVTLPEEALSVDHKVDVQAFAWRLLLGLSSDADNVDQRLLDRMFFLARDFGQLRLADRWTLLATLDRCLHQKPTLPYAYLSLEQIYAMQPPLPPEDLNRQIAAIRGKAMRLLDPRYDSETSATGLNLKFWSTHVDGTFESFGAAGPAPLWHIAANGELIHSGGHEQDDVIFALPLTGRFSVQFELSRLPFTEYEMFYGGHCVMVGGLKLRSTKIDIGRDIFDQKQLVHPPLTLDHWYQCRIDVNEGLVRRFVEGQLIDESPIDSHRHPWLGFRTWFWRRAGVRNIRMLGDPVIPDELQLSTGNDLLGWSAKLWKLQFAEKNAPWKKDENIIVGTRFGPEQHGHRYSTLQYHRPMMEDGVVEYEFFYEPGRVITHFAMDRLAFRMAGSRILLHWMKDSNGGRPLPDDYRVFAESKNDRGNQALHLKSGWNQTRAELRGAMLNLYLNGNHIYEYKLESTNLRTFGFFHDRRKTESRIRNVVYRGAWPKTLTDEARNELAGDPVSVLVRNLGQPKSTEEIDFSDRKQLVSLKCGGLQNGPVSVTSDGLRITGDNGVDSRGHGIYLPTRIEGDFDITATYKDLEVTGSGPVNGGCFLTLRTDGPFAEEFHLRCISNLQDQYEIQAWRRYVHPDGIAHIDNVKSTFVPSATGQLRVIRCGLQLHFLHSEAGQNAFRHIGSHYLFSPDCRITAYILGVIDPKARKRTSVTLKKLTIARHTQKD